MRIIGIGTDIIEIERLAAVFNRFEDAFRTRVYTGTELTLAHERNNDICFFAGRWAAKEAASKALGCGIGARCAFTDIEITNDGEGRPQLLFRGAAAQTFAAIGGKHIALSISHERRYAVATVIITN